MRTDPSWLERTLYGAGTPSPLARLLAKHEGLAWASVAGLLLFTSWIVERTEIFPPWVALTGYALVGVIGGRQPVLHLLRALRQGAFHLDIDFLMVVAAIGAASVGAWAEGAFLLFLFALANALEEYALDRARSAIRNLADLAPAQARLLRDGVEVEIPVEQVRVGDVLVVRPSERLPADGVVRAGRSAVNQAPITGESVPVEKEPGDEVFAGTVNGDGALELTATRAVGDRTLDRVIRLVEEAQAAKAPVQRITERFERIFVPVVVVADILLIVVPGVMGWMPWGESLYRGMTVLVAASPCAIALGAPAAMLAGIAQAAKHGVLLKGGGLAGGTRHGACGRLRQDRHAHGRATRGDRRDTRTGGDRGRAPGRRGGSRGEVPASAGAGRGPPGRTRWRDATDRRRVAEHDRTRCPRGRRRTAGADRQRAALG